MLVDFPTLKRKLIENYNRELKVMSKNDPFISSIKEEKHFEGDKMQVGAIGGISNTTKYKEISSEYPLDRNAIINEGPTYLKSFLGKMANDIMNEQSNMVFSSLDETVKKTGNIVNSKDGILKPETFFDLLEKMDIDFDKNGNSRGLSLVVSPETAAKLSRLVPEWEKNKDFDNRYKEIIAIKRKDWDVRESHRKLVD